MMVGKRKVDQLRTNIAKMARAAESGDKEEFKKASIVVLFKLDGPQLASKYSWR